MLKKSSKNGLVVKKKKKSTKTITKHTFMCGPTKFSVNKKYKFLKMMGGGAYGVVCSALNQSTNKKVAIKKIGNAFEDLIDAKRIYREIKLLQFIDHPNIISLYDIDVPEKPKTYDDIYIITELMETDLHRVIYSK